MTISRRAAFLDVRWREAFLKAYSLLPADRQRSCDEVAIALVKQEPTPGHRVKPILPEKYFYEARISSGDRIIFRVEAGTIFFYDIVKHDDIARYSKRPRTVR